VACWRLPVLVSPIFRVLYHLHFAIAATLRWAYRVFYAGPLFVGRCDSVGKNFSLMKIPDTPSQTHLSFGDGVRLQGHLAVASGRVFDNPEFSVGDRVTFGPFVFATASKQIRIGNDVKIGGGSRFLDTDGHPRDTMSRIADDPPPADEIKSVQVGSNVTIGRKSIILKGVTIGDGAKVGVSSVVVANVPPNAVVAGNPARLVSRTATAAPVPPPPAPASTDSERQ